MPKTIINAANTWRTAKEIHINDAGTWRKGKELWTKRNGVWRKIYQSALQLNIDTNTTDYDLFTQAGSPTAPIDIVLTIGLNITVGASATTHAAIRATAPLPQYSTLHIINKGIITGAGGNGFWWRWIDKNPWVSTQASTPGGPALNLPVNTTINNASGIIQGGGGGGGGGQWDVPYYSQNQMIGGGGAGSSPGEPGACSNRWATQWWYANPGTLKTGGTGRWITTSSRSGNFPASSGGNPGEPGSSPDTYYYDTHGKPGGWMILDKGGAAGRAVERNGYPLTFISGENADQLKGAYD